ncbi:hypothetical protein PGIGA_G00215670 [Pangasianodon gigas]|uniref:Uncharacterized protein n=1 Tax=Pangasianodon gigas TaxID=30993 RepID=A0ACC5WHR2_PANGG|nr:hypothetical protein [Pangasianodon gigas]
MRFSLWPVSSYSLALLSFLSQCVTAVERHYYIAAVNINWDYTTNGTQSAGPIYKKTVYREYDPGFKTAKTTPWSGLLGPTLRGQVGDTIIVTFRNMADHPCSIHPHGIAYGKQSEGALYFDNTSQFEKEDDVILPGKEHTYYWEVTPEVAPQAADPPCVTYTYFSHNDIVKDYNTGLIGTLLICKPGSLDESGKQVHFNQEFTLLFGVFDESNTWYSKGDAPLKENVKYTINGFTNGSVPNLSVCAHSKVTWNLVGMSSEPELFSVHFNGQVLQQSGHKVSSIGIISGTATSAEMMAIYPGRWLLSSHISKHLEAGMHGFLQVNKCEEFTAPKRKLTIQQRRDSQVWIYYIAAEEIIWDYAPNLPENVDRNFRSTYLKQGAWRIGKKYKKAVFTQYTDESFKERAEHKQRKKELGILGPVIRAQIRDIIKIVFKNKASRPYSIYPHGLTIDKAAEGVNYPEGGYQSHAVQPGETYTYVWQVIEEDEPLNSDSRCLTRMYHSAVNTPQDIASGLVGPLLICKSQSLSTRNVQLRADKEQHAMFAVFDENKSWYLNENILTYCGEPKNVKPDDPEFYKSNVMHTINGYMYESGQDLGFCNGEIATWHVSSVGEQDDIQTATFYGHTFELNNREEDILSLFPMTGETITMNMANIGVWLMASLNTHETQKGLRLKFKDVECFRDYVMEDSYNDNDYDISTDVTESYNVWKPINETVLKKEKSKPKPSTNVIDPDTDDYALLLVQEDVRHMDIEISLAEFREHNGTQDDPYLGVQEPNSTNRDSEISNNTLYDSDTFFGSESTEKTNIPHNVTISAIQSVPFTDYAHNETMSQKVSSLWTSSDEIISESFKNTSFSNGIFNVSSTESNSSHTNILLPNSSSEWVTPDVDESLNEVVIYLKDSNNTMAILTTPLDTQAKNWSYDGKHELVPVEFPDYMNKYITDKQPNNAKEEKKKVHLQRVTPKKGHGMKTKKRKEYKPQLRSDISPPDFSPRGFAPPQLTPKTTKLSFSEEDMMPKAIVIGIPRNDFIDYEIYVPHDMQDFDADNTPSDKEEYEYVEYKNPYAKLSETDLVDEVTKYTLQMAGSKSRVYFITAEEVNWDYGGYGQRREDKASVKERPMLFKKVLFRSYLDSSFTTPDTRGEVDEHLGIMGPVIKAEVDETIYIVFRNLASRPYSLHANGVSYSKNMEGLNYEDDSPYWYKYDDAVQPNATFTYIWTVNDKVGPINGESDCRIWTYYSAVNPERDIHSGLIGPLLICRKGTLAKNPIDTQEFMLLFMTFDENKSWYYERNWEILKKTNKKATMDPNFNNNIKFHAINGIIYSLKGLRMYANQLVNWHLINMGSPKDFHSIHFHGQTFCNKHNDPHRQGVYPLLPGGFATLEMWPSKPGLWMLESEVGISQQRGMQTLFLVLDNVCDHPLGLSSGAVKDSQITASDSRGYWLPNLARLYNTGKYNAWSTTKPDPWIQVDFQRPVVISKIATQGAKQLFTSHFVLNYTIFYSTDRKRWSWYKGDSKTSRKTFEGNTEAHEVKENIFFPPIISRYVRLYPSHSYNYPTVRMEFFGCELDGCSVPLGMQSGLISDHQITASSVASNWYSSMWQPWLARLDKQGSLNAWQAKSNDMHPWLQIELKDVKKITGIVTQGAKSLNTEMFVTTYVLEYSDDGKKWTKYSDNEDYEVKTFMGNSDNNSHVKNYIYPPIFSRFIRIIPTKWQNAATMRVELLGCDFA